MDFDIKEITQLEKDIEEREMKIKIAEEKTWETFFDFMKKYYTESAYSFHQLFELPIKVDNYYITTVRRALAGDKLYIFYRRKQILYLEQGWISGFTKIKIKENSIFLLEELIEKIKVLKKEKLDKKLFQLDKKEAYLKLLKPIGDIKD